MDDAPNRTYPLTRARTREAAAVCHRAAWADRRLWRTDRLLGSKSDTHRIHTPTSSMATGIRRCTHHWRRCSRCTRTAHRVGIPSTCAYPVRTRRISLRLSRWWTPSETRSRRCFSIGRLRLRVTPTIRTLAIGWVCKDRNSTTRGQTYANRRTSHTTDRCRFLTRKRTQLTDFGNRGNNL